MSRNNSDGANVGSFLFLLLFQLLVGPTTYGQTKNVVLNPPIEAQYLRINPQYWSYSRMCLKTEFYGCSGEQGKIDLLYD